VLRAAAGYLPAAEIPCGPHLKAANYFLLFKYRVGRMRKHQTNSDFAMLEHSMGCISYLCDW
jgi:hypothetical protein